MPSSLSNTSVAVMSPDLQGTQAVEFRDPGCWLSFPLSFSFYPIKKVAPQLATRRKDSSSIMQSSVLIRYICPSVSLEGWFQEVPVDAQIPGCLSPLYKTVQYIKYCHFSLSMCFESTGFSSSDSTNQASILGWVNPKIQHLGIQLP